MNEHEFAAIIHLAEVDQQRMRLEHQSSAAERAVAVAERAKIDHTEQLKQSHDALQKLKKQQALFDLELKQIAVDEKTKQKKIEDAGPREYMALEHEIAMLAQKKSKIESEYMMLWANIEEMETVYANQVRTHADAVRELDEGIAAHRASLEQYRKELDSLKFRYDAIRPEIPAEWLKRYDAMRAALPNPIVAIVNNSCGGCFYALPAQDLAEARSRKLVVCKDCFRILYA